MDLLIGNSLNLPNTVVLSEVVRKWRPDPATYRGLSRFPFRDHPSPQIRWRVLEAVTGMTHARALNSDFKVVQFKPRSIKLESTAYWGETGRVNEDDMLNAMSFAGTDIGQRAGRELVMELAEDLDTRLNVRTEYLIWKAVLAGALNINEDNVIRDVDYDYTADNAVNAGVAWSTVATADPVKDMQTWAYDFAKVGGTRPDIFINGKTAINLSQNAKLRDLVQRSNLATDIGLNNVGGLLKILAGNVGDVVVYDQGYLAADGTYTRFIPDDKAVVLAQHWQGKPIGFFMTTPAIQNGGIANPRPGKWALAEDHTGKKVPCYDLTVGIHGLPIILYPQLIKIASV